MVSPRREPRSQHFLWDRRLVDRLVRASSISPHELVLEIGPGRGILTQALLQVAARVVAVELDPKLYHSLRQTLGHCSNLDLVCGDFLDLPLPPQPYKVFANIPFHITGDIVRKLLQGDTPPEDCYLLVQREAAGKYLPGERHNSLAALLYYPWWEISITHHFRRTDFVPPPSVDSVLLRMTRRETPLLALGQKAIYQDCVAYRFGHDRGAKDATPTQFLSAFRGFIQRSNPRQRRVIHGAFTRLQEEQRHLQKIHRTRTDPNWKRFGRK